MKRKLLPSLYHLFKENELADEFSILAFDRVSLSIQEYQTMIKEAVKTFEDDFDEKNGVSLRLTCPTCQGFSKIMKTMSVWMNR